MPTPRRLLTVLVRSMTLYETGDRKVPEAQNAINALLVFPVPGRSEVFTTTGLIPGLTDGKALRFTPPLLLLKEAVQGVTDLQLVVTDRDDRNALVSFLRRLGAAVAGSAAQALAADVPGIFRAAFREAAASGQMAIGSQREDKLEVVASGFLPLRDLDTQAGLVTVDLVAPRELQRKGKPPLKRGAPNGSLELELVVDRD
jgi:hypothetical protein